MKNFITRATVVLVLTFGAVTLVGAPAQAVVATEGAASISAPAQAVAVLTEAAPAAPAFAFTIDLAAVVQLLVAFILPVIVGLVTTKVTNGGTKAWLLAGLTLVTSLLVELGRTLAEGATYDLGVALLTALPAFVISVSSHYGLWKPTGVSAAAADTLVTPKNGNA